MARIVKACSYIASGVLFAMVFLTTADVVGRYVFNKPIKGGMEMSELGLVVIFFLGLSYTGIMKKHVSVDFFISNMSVKMRAAINTFNSLVCTVLFVLIGWQGFGQAVYAFNRGLTTDLLRIPVFPFKFLVPIGALLISVVFVAKGLQSLKTIKETK